MNRRSKNLLERTLAVFVVLTIGVHSCSVRPAAAQSKQPFPRKPIKVVVYMKAGGLIDVTSRKFVEIASKYDEATFVVENKPGAGGIVAMNSVLNQPADGHTLFAVTKSNIAKFVSSGCDSAVESFHWLALLMRDPECIITNKLSDTPDFKSLVANAKSLPGQQNWLGPATGGLDHIFALKTWNALGVDAKWIPHDNGGQAVAALLGQQGVAYVGNPRETLGKTELQIAAVSAAERLPQFPNAPTLRELGVAGLHQENMWRGFAIKGGTPTPIIEWYKQIIDQVTSDPDWRNYWESGGIEVVHWQGDRFRDVVRKDREEFRTYLSELKIISSADEKRGFNFSSGVGLTATMVAFSLICVVFSMIYASIRDVPIGEGLIPSFIVALAVLFWMQTSTFPSEGSDIGAKSLPRIYAMSIFVLVGFVLLGRRAKPTSERYARFSSAFPSVVGSLLLYPLVASNLGFYLATAIFLVVVMKSLRVTNWKVTCFMVGGWLLIAYGFFYRLLFVQLPLGKLWES